MEDFIQVLSLEVDRENKRLNPCLHFLYNGDTLEGLRRIIDCELVTCTEIEVGSKLFDVWSDDEGLLVYQPVPTLYISDELILFGNLVFATNDEGKTAGITNADIPVLLKYLDEQAEKLFLWYARRSLICRAEVV